MTIALLLLSVAALGSLVSALLTSANVKALMRVSEVTRESLDVYADRVQSLADRMLTLEAAVRKLEGETRELHGNWRIPTKSEDVTPAEKPKKKRR